MTRRRELDLLGCYGELVSAVKVTGFERLPCCLPKLPGLGGEKHDRFKIGSAP